MTRRRETRRRHCSGLTHVTYRPAEVETLLGDPTKAHEKLGWKPEITLQEMVSEMVAKDLEAAKKHSLLKSHGYEVAIALES